MVKSMRNRPHYSVEERKRWMDLLARCSSEQLLAYYRDLDPRPRYDLLDAGGDGIAPSTRGEGRSHSCDGGVLTRCVVRLPSGVTGTACLAGRRRKHAVMAAVFDALLKEPDRYDELIGTVIESMAYDVYPAVSGVPSDHDAGLIA